MADPEAWRLEAACRSAPLHWFYPDRGGTLGDARRLCRACPVSDDCLAYVMTTEDPAGRFGFWSGTTAKQRRGMRRTQYQPMEHERSA